MKTIIFLLTFILFTTMAFAGDVWVNGYYRSDGTYIQGHRRSAPNQNKWDNYGKKPQNNNSYYAPYSPYSRDYDRDGILNKYYMDDDNDGKLDDYDRD